MAQRDVAGVRAWYKTHDQTSELGYNPDGMCLRICREARNIGAMYPSALSAQEATPREHRITKIRDIKPGHVLYFDNRADDNPYGHIVTAVARVNGVDPNSLDSILTRTNSVKSGRVVVVKASYFNRFWADPFVFAADWLNGEELIMPKKKAPKPALGEGRERRMRHAVDMLQDMIDKAVAEDRPRFARALKRDQRELLETLRTWEGK